MSATTMFERAANAAMGAILGSPSHAPSSTAGGAGSRETPAAVAVKPPPAVSVAKAPEPFDPDDVSHAEILKHAFCMWARVSPHAAVVADGFGWPLGSGPVFEPVELQRPGQPVLP